MFKIFKKEDFMGNYCHLLNNNNILAITKNGSIVELSEDNKWEFKKRNDYIVISNLSLTKENLAFQIIEPGEYEYIDVYKVIESHIVNGVHILNEHYVAHEYDTHYDLAGSYYLIKDIKEFKEYVANDYSFISYNSNYMEEL